jgi:cell division protein FtsQ
LPARSARAYFEIMDRSRRRSSRDEAAVPSESRLTLGSARRNNRRRATPFRERMPDLRRAPGRFADGCGRALRRAAPALLLAAVAGAVGTAAWAGYRFVTTSPRFAIETIEVSGATTLGPDGIRARIPVAIGDNLFRADLDAIELALEREPWIAEATVRRELPRTLVIDVRERTAAALVDLDGLYLADAEGHVFKRARLDAGEGAGLPVVTGIARADHAASPDAAAERIRLGLATLAAWNGSPAPPERGAEGAESKERPAVGEVRVDRRHGTTLYTFDDAVAIRLGEATGDALAGRLDTFDAAWAALSAEERQRARAIHLDHDTRPDHVTVAFTR